MPRMKYQNNAGVVGTTAVGKGFEGPEVYGVEPTAAAQEGVYFRKAGSRRQRGTQVRYLVCSRNDGPLTPSGQQPKLFSLVTVGTQEAFNNYSENEEINLPGGVFTIDTKRPEG